MYVDGFVLSVPKNKIKQYQKIAYQAGKIWMEHGAVEYMECAGEDLQTKWGVSFPKLAKAKPNETVFFSYIVFKSKAHRNKVNAKVMKDKRLKCNPADMPFDCKRMSYGGFKPVVSF